MQEQLQLLIHKFKNHQYYSQNNHRRNVPSRKLHSNELLNQEIIQLNQRIKYLQETIQSLITDGNKMNKCYQEIFYQTVHQFDTLKQQYDSRENSHKEELHQDKKTIEELCRKIQNLHHQITQKQEKLKDVQYRYQELVERATEVHIASSSEVKQIEIQLIQQSKNLYSELNQSRKLIDQKQIQMTTWKQRYQRIITQNGLLKDQNGYFMKQNHKLLQEINYLKLKLQHFERNNNIRIDDRQQSDESQQYDKMGKSSLKHDDILSDKSSQKMAFDGIIHVNGRQVNFNQEKQLLNISQHYCKSFVRNRSFEKSKFFQNDLDQVNSSKSNIIKPQPLPKMQLPTKPSVANITQIPQKQQQTYHNTITQAKIHLEESLNHIQDPYRSFFMLLTQCQKLNSPYFNQISTLNLNYLFQTFIKTCVPYNKWQQSIKNQLEKKIQRSANLKRSTNTKKQKSKFSKK